MSDEITTILLGLKQDMGKVLQGQENLTAHINAVSDKANRIRDEISEHSRDSEAHGIGTALRTIKIVGSVAGGLLAAFEAFVHLGKP